MEIIYIVSELFDWFLKKIFFLFYLFFYFFFFMFFLLFSKFLRFLLKVTEVTTEHQKWPKIGKNRRKTQRARKRQGQRPKPFAGARRKSEQRAVSYSIYDKGSYYLLNPGKIQGSTKYRQNFYLLLYKLLDYCSHICQ